MNVNAKQRKLLTLNKQRVSQHKATEPQRLAAAVQRLAQKWGCHVR